MQDWTAATSITDFVWDHELEEMAFTYTPNVDGPTLTGTLRVEVPAETYGGDVNTRITSDFEWFIIGDVTRTAATLLLANQTVDQLKAQAAEKGLPTSGTKAELIERLQGELVPA